ncbi:uncharacterized protein LY79DRAFT_514232 [Colletotrichum navitas]|uniref:Uncharacterized protein n=1 Tax=Colletotrichum navitas TaxID=681940 RepID=A0AAD8Q125_9PEZI|nr:uncharacterized protein LY79DRAFT_514232 [Colletotrichum navitas]KAK1593530.1 hypothetical protein LY79DRAFT_514232 [Colletotrichum navitas]
MFEMIYTGYFPCSSDRGDASLVAFSAYIVPNTEPKLKIDTTRDVKTPSGASNSSIISATAGKGIEDAMAL